MILEQNLGFASIGNTYNWIMDIQ